MRPLRWTLVKSPKAKACRALVSSLAPSVSPRNHFGYSSQPCSSRNAFSLSASGCTAPHSLSSTTLPALIRSRQCRTAARLTLYFAMQPSWDRSVLNSDAHGAAAVQRVLEARPAGIGQVVELTAWQRVEVRESWVVEHGADQRLVAADNQTGWYAARQDPQCVLGHRTDQLVG